MNPKDLEPTPVFHHVSVMVNEVIHFLNPQPGKTYLDATFGGGGHTKAILNAEPNCKVIGLDWDMKAIEHNAPALQEQYGDRLKIVWGNFALLYKVLKKDNIDHLDGILADFGTSQFQIHHKEGFSFQKNTYLDMRMSPAHQPATAANIVNQYTESQLIRIFQDYGQETASRTIAQAIVAARKEKEIRTTGDLVAIIESVVNAAAFRASRGISPATQVFQALRIEVNQELANIHSFLMAGMRALSPGGSIVCISFHSLEDRIVKSFFKDHSDQLETLTRKPALPSEEEIRSNPSSRSAKLRAAVKKKVDKCDYHL